MTETLLIVHAGATWFMVGLIWFVQIVHYPLFAGVGVEGWVAYEARHRTRTTWVVLPVMLVELATTVSLALGVGADLVPRAWPWIGAALLAVIWISTFGAQVPLHEKLRTRHSPRAMRALVATNWVRTTAWSLRGLVALVMLR